MAERGSHIGRRGISCSGRNFKTGGMIDSLKETAGYRDFIQKGGGKGKGKIHCWRSPVAVFTKEGEDSGGGWEEGTPPPRQTLKADSAPEHGRAYRNRQIHSEKEHGRRKASQVRSLVKCNIVASWKAVCPCKKGGTAPTRDNPKWWRGRGGNPSGHIEP